MGSGVRLSVTSKRMKTRSFASTMGSMAMSKKGCKVMRLADSIKLSTYGLFRSGAKICRPVLCDREKAVQLAT